VNSVLQLVYKIEWHGTRAWGKRGQNDYADFGAAIRLQNVLFQLLRSAPGRPCLYADLGEQGSFLRGDEEQVVVQQVEGLGKKDQPLAAWRLGCLGLGEFIPTGQKVGRCLFGRPLLERRLRAGPPGQSPYGFPPSRWAGADFAFGVGTKKQGEPRPTRYGLRRKHEERYE